ncbi:MAG: tRNA pseudouridine(55) synthase TruB [Candidatus Obscuribacterales bacterium]|nr:tRNA pseudouridine(55) synthase TruB [Candidatus Obscuribacterales bacterium]
MFGFLNVAKPSGMTSHAVINRLRKALKLRHIGHGGTLDPLAEGVLPVAIGSACRLLRFLDHDKTYLAKILFGQTTTTDDIEGEVIATNGDLPKEESVRESLLSFQGTITQLAPLYSAIHVDGKRLYELAREGKAPAALPERTVTIYSNEFIAYEAPYLTLRVHCSSGTYIRSIARDLGKILECGGCLQSLLREQAGKLHLAQAKTLAEIEACAQANQAASLLISPQQVLPLPTAEIDADQARTLRLGQKIFLADNPAWQEYVMATWQNSLVAVCAVKGRNNELIEIAPKVVLNDE